MGKTKDELIEEAEELGLEVSEDDNYNEIRERVSTARAAQEQEDEESSEQRICSNCDRPAVVTDDADGIADPRDFCEVHAP